MKHQHQPVLLNQVIELLEPQPGDSYLDATAGFGGHAAAILEKTSGKSVLVDRDPTAVEHLEAQFGDRASIYQASFVQAAKQLLDVGEQFDLILLDVGVSSPQFDSPERGFSFSGNGPLDMRMDPTQTLSAAEIVNKYSEYDLKRIIGEYGEEHKAGRVARAIASQRPFNGTQELADAVRKAVGYSGKIDSATRTFQAIRIEVNGELEQLRSGLPLMIDLLAEGGRIAVISFHSLEDRIVKQAFKEANDLEILTKKPLSGRDFDNNPRARSAKLRAAKKIKTLKEGKK